MSLHTTLAKLKPEFQSVFVDARTELQRVFLATKTAVGDIGTWTRDDMLALERAEQHLFSLFHNSGATVPTTSTNEQTSPIIKPAIPQPTSTATSEASAALQAAVTEGMQAHPAGYSAVAEALTTDEPTA